MGKESSRCVHLGLESLASYERGKGAKCRADRTLLVALLSAPTSLVVFPPASQTMNPNLLL